jgi:catalase
MQGVDFQPMTTDIYTRIGQNGETASWELYLQTMDPEQLDDFDFNPLDTTKVWPESLIPAKKIGKLTLNRVPDNFFEETEQAAFAPSNLIPGIEPSEDRMLQGRLFSYADTQRYRIGTNAYRIPINAPRNASINNHEQHGKLRTTNSTRDVNYQPSRRLDLNDDNQYKYVQTPLAGTTQQAPFYKQRNFAQAGEKFRSFSKVEQQHLIENLGSTLAGVGEEEIRVIISAYMYNADKDYGKGVAKLANAPLKKVKATAKYLLNVQAEREAHAKKVAQGYSRIRYNPDL